MTTNLEITDEAVNAATGVYGGPTGRMRAALAAALPHLRVQETRPTERLESSVPQETVIEPGLALPLCHPDGVVRSGALHHGQDYTCTGSAHFDGVWIACTSVAHRPQEAARLAPHPRPVVDREALVKAFGAVYLENILYDHEIDTLANAILALVPTEEDTKA